MPSLTKLEEQEAKLAESKALIMGSNTDLATMKENIEAKADLDNMMAVN